MTDDYYYSLIERQRLLLDELANVRSQMSQIHAFGGGRDYRIALRPDDRDADNTLTTTRLDDIVVKDVPMFRAEQMDTNIWWACCYLDNETGDRICWDIRAKTKPLRINWVTTEWPNQHVIYEDD